MKFKINLALLAILLLVGCTSPVDESGMTGYVMKKEGGRILVVNSNPQDFSSTGGVEEYYDAIWFSKAPASIEVGQQVKVWFDIVADSYPGQSEVQKIEVIPSQKPAGAALSPEEALKKALTSPDMQTQDTIAVKGVEFQSGDGLWYITLKNVWERDPFVVEVEDR